MASSNTKVLEVHLVGDGVSLDRTLTTSAKTAAKSATAMEAAGGRMIASGKKVEAAGKKWTKSLTLPIVALGAGAVKLGLDFGHSMELISTQAGGSVKEVKLFEKQMLSATAKGRFSQGPEELAEAMYHVRSEGFKGAKAWKIEKSAADLAAVGHANLAETTNAVTAATKTGIKGTQDFTKEVGTLNAAIGAGNMTMEELTAAMGTGFLVTAKQVGISLTGATSALAQLTALGVPAVAGATRLRMAFSLMAAPSKTAEDAMKGIGLSGESLAKKLESKGGLVSALRLLREHLKGMSHVEQTQVLTKMFGGAKSSATIIALLDNLDELEEKQKEINKNADDFNNKLKETKANPIYKLEVAWSKIQSRLISLGKVLVPDLIHGFEKLSDIVFGAFEWFSKLPDGVKTTAIEIAGITAAIGPILTIAGKFYSVWGRIYDAIGKAKAAVVGFGAAQGEMSAGAGASGFLFGAGADGSAAALASKTPKSQIESILGDPRAGLPEYKQKVSEAIDEVAIQAAYDEANVSTKIAKPGFFKAGWESAKSLASGFATKFGPLLAAVGIGNIITSVVNKDGMDAVYETGGAIAGGLIGGIVGGLPGAMVGVGLGSIGGEILSSIFGGDNGEQKTIDYFKRAKRALEGLKNTSQSVSKMQHHQKSVSEEVKAAEERLSNTREKFGPHSQKAIEAEAELIQKRRHLKKLNREIQEQEHQRKGPERRAAEIGLRHDVPKLAGQQGRLIAEQKEEREQLQALIANYHHGEVTYAKVKQKQDELSATQDKLRHKTKQLGDIYQEAGQKIGQKFSAKLQNLGKKSRELTMNLQVKAPEIGKELSAELVRSERITRKGVNNLIGFLNELPKGSRKAAQQTIVEMVKRWAAGNPKLEAQVSKLTGNLTKKYSHATQGMKHGTKETVQKLLGWFGSLSGGVGTSISSIGETVNSLLSGLGVSKLVKFAVHAAKGIGSVLGLQTGGTVPGHGDGDKVPAALPPGSFVMNKRATKAYGFQSGGAVPVMLEPGERWFHPDEVQRHGLGNLESINRSVPRFAEGGYAKKIPHPRLSGVEPLRGAGQKGIDKNYNAAVKYVNKHSEPPRILKALHAMETQASKGYPYVYGGGHGSFSGPFDCSGYVSYGLHAAGFINTPMAVSQGSGLYTLGVPGQGKFLTWGVRGSSGMSAHTMMAIKGPGGKWHYFEAGGSGGGAHTDSGWDGSFQFRHMPGYQKGGQIPGVAKRQIDKYGSEAMNPRSSHFVGWGYQHGGSVQALQKGGMVVKGKVSYEGGTGHATADGKHTDEDPGFAIRDDSTLGDWFWSKVGGHQGLLQHIDWGPAEWTGRNIDFTEAGLRKIGSGLNITDTFGSVEWKGHTVAEASKNLGGKTGTSTTKATKEPKIFEGCQTKALDFPPLPKELKKTNEYIGKYSQLVGKYKKAAKDAGRNVGKKDGIDWASTAHDLTANVNSIKNYLRQLRNSRKKLRVEAAKKKISKKLAARMAKIAGKTTEIEAGERQLEEVEEEAQQVVDLEPTQAKDEDEKAFEQKFKNYVEGDEKSAYMKILDVAGKLRETILGAEDYATNEEGKWEGQIRGTDHEIDYSHWYIGKKVPDDIEQWKAEYKANWKKAHPKQKFPGWPPQSQWPDWLQKEIGKSNHLKTTLPIKVFRDQSLRTVLGEGREAFYGSKKNPVGPHTGVGGDYGQAATTPPIPLEGTGSFEDSLINLQGVHWPNMHSKIFPLPVNPVVGQFGGQIWDTQMAIKELGIKLSEAGGSGGGGSDDNTAEKLQVAEEISMRERLRAESLEATAKTMSSLGQIGPKGLKATYPWAGRYAKGGPVAALVGENGPEIALMEGGSTHITDARKTEQLMKPSVVVNNHHYGDRTETEVLVNGKKIEAVVNHVALKLGTRANHRAQTSSDGKLGTL